MIRYLSKAELEPIKVINTFKEISEKGGEIAMSMATKLIDEGRAKGKIEGKIEGVQEAIELGLELKYGTDGLKLYKKIVIIKSIEKLEAIKEAIKISKTLVDVENLV